MVYEFQCKKCNAVHEKVLPLKKLTTTIRCKDCGGNARRIISGRQAAQTFEPHFNKIQNKYFRTKKEFESYCRERNLYKPTEQEIRRHREEFSGVGPK